MEGNRDIILNEIHILLHLKEDPKSFSEAMASRDATFWKEAIHDDMDSILSNNTWRLEGLPLDSKPVGCKWVFKRKYNTD